MHLQASSGIFIVEDNLLYQQLIARELEDFGGPIYFYTTGEHCLANICRKPSIVVLDYNLDGEINGLETLEEIRKFDPSIFVILFSSQKDLHSNENQRRYGSFDFLEKKEQSFTLLKQLLKAKVNF
ncbi:MAG TPA: response regulator [Puia sp.]|jgi:two-component system OmpR family response regulator|nr:response regulator [Puia sp.]